MSNGELPKEVPLEAIQKYVQELQPGGLMFGNDPEGERRAVQRVAAVVNNPTFQDGFRAFSASF
ncbi:MAG: hypothetical protein UV63_C0036G0018 [Microgenomates group bacterium GW2011_GWC1_43_11]|uniref:Uncharacterized protein n=2 Tax=Candidatus Gottesmaniibacteriota TaxID=1752720 RepID=A0A0G1KWH8_9BACT|nr:MAG: hypothetical protein UV63_C0036G0018 [Microgenomates group bacterium GW2011_GWC1_43_11]KKT38049.1 MAG: hypothetical protein UW22_C0014G0008 [Candidatus Gottesmanbacteria bacterium GW2011_GWB1_44_11c]KKT60647.1 MAG: hypothetical protein UW52_C0020G0005 [Candidatus Gottesmanbacteria bacterium GW2011_GWA1_44_24b]HCM81875.1 hypothetical protein [Patescibacteria group bacterium]